MLVISLLLLLIRYVLVLRVCHGMIVSCTCSATFIDSRSDSYMSDLHITRFGINSLTTAAGIYSTYVFILYLYLCLYSFIIGYRRCFSYVSMTASTLVSLFFKIYHCFT
jgi:membrane-anchored protein YejM (alkaline phosphatase superfamily)